MPKIWRSAIATTALCAILGLCTPPVNASGAVTNMLSLPLQETVLNPNASCVEGVPLSGMVRLVSILTPQPPPILCRDPRADDRTA